MNQFDKTTLKVLREDINEALTIVANQHNIKISVGNCSYLEDSCTFKLECSLPNALKKTERDLETELEYREQSSIAITLDRTKIAYSDDGNHYKLVGYKTRARKNPFIIEKVIGGKINTKNEWIEMFQLLMAHSEEIQGLSDSQIKSLLHQSLKDI